MTIEEMAAGGTLAEEMGMTAELGLAIAELAEGEMDAGRLDDAKDILEGLAIANPRDALGWTLLSRVERLRGDLLAARFCAEVAVQLAPGDEEARLALAEALLADEEHRERARSDLAKLAISATGQVRERARALCAALDGQATVR
jgi:cytochrome c-type biogenesis protein CcmH/NrfG